MDMAVKLGAACVMTAAGAWGGRMAAAVQTRRARVLRELAGGVKGLRIQMLERRSPLKEALRETGGVFGEAARELEEGGPPGRAWARALERLQRRGEGLDCLEEGDKAALNRLFQGLGESGAQGQRLLLEEAAEELRRLAEEAGKREAEHGRLYASLGTLGGAALALLLL